VGVGWVLSDSVESSRATSPHHEKLRQRGEMDRPAHIQAFSQVCQVTLVHLSWPLNLIFVPEKGTALLEVHGVLCARSSIASGI
jgi:hypothetical protein